MHSAWRYPVVALAVACASAHAAQGPAAAAASAPETSAAWPKPPQSPRARFVAAVTAARPPSRPSWWKRTLRYLAGVEDGEASTDPLVRPFDVAVRPDGSFVVADPDRPGVVAYGSDGAFAADLTCPGDPWAAPMSAAVSEDGALWIADAAAPAIVRWTELGCRVLRPEGLERPTGIAISRGRIVVADPPAHHVLVLAPDGTKVAQWGERGDGERQFNFPTDVATGADGSLFVVDALHFRIVHLADDGRWLGAFGEPGEQGAGLARPKGVDVDPSSGLVYVTDAQRDVVLVFRSDGVLEYVLGEPGVGPGQFAHPAGVSARGGRLVVADSVNRRAQVFELLGEPR